MGYCKHLAEFDAHAQAWVGQRLEGNFSVVTIDVGVTFHRPRRMDHRPLPFPCLPSLPHNVGDVAKVRLVWATNLHKAGNWIFTTWDQKADDGEYLGWLPGPEARTDYWRFTFKLPPWGIWKTVHADYALRGPYKKRHAQDNCAYYKDDSVTVHNLAAVFCGDGLKTIAAWEPEAGELPLAAYECNFIQPNELFVWSTPDELKSVQVAPPLDVSSPYELNYDYEGGFRDNLVELNFREPGVYAARFEWKTGSQVKFFAVGALARPLPPITQTLPLSRAVRADSPGFTSGFYVSQDQAMEAVEKTIFPKLETALEVEKVVIGINENFMQTGVPGAVLFATHGNPGQIEFDGQYLAPFPGGYGYSGQCMGPYDLDRIIDGCDVDGMKCVGLRGGADTVHFWSSFTGKDLPDKPCHILKYVAEKMVEFGGVQTANAYGWDGPVFAVQGGLRRPSYFSVAQDAQYVNYTSHSTYMPVGVPERKGSDKEPNFYA
jgi:hypothetical protein